MLMTCLLDETVECNENCQRLEECPLEEPMPCSRPCDGECKEGRTCPYQV